MGLESFKYVLDYGLIGGAFLFMLWTTHKREVKLMGFMNDMGKDMTRISKALTGLEHKMEAMQRERIGRE